MKRNIQKARILLPTLMLTLCVLVVSCSAKSNNSEPAESLFDRDNTVKNAYISLNVKNLDTFRDEIYQTLNNFESEVDSESWNDKNKMTGRISISIRLPSKHFLSYIDYINETYKVESMHMHAHKITKDSLKNKEIDLDGTVYSFIHISASRKIGYSESFIIGTEHASEALKYSLQSIIPVILFVLPYLLIIFTCILIYKQLKKVLKNKGTKDSQQ